MFLLFQGGIFRFHVSFGVEKSLDRLYKPTWKIGGFASEIEQKVPLTLPKMSCFLLLTGLPIGF